MELILIRHGITQGNLERRYLGQRNDQSLAREGIRQLEDYAARKRYPRADALYSSPMKRCVETARLLYPMMVPVVLPSLTELDFGSFDGKNYEQLKDDPAYRRWIATGGMTAPTGGESGAEFTARLEGALRQIAADARRLGIRRPAGGHPRGLHNDDSQPGWPTKICQPAGISTNIRLPTAVDTR